MIGYLIWFVALVIGVGVSFWLIANDEGDSISGWRGRVLDCSIGVFGCAGLWWIFCYWVNAGYWVLHTIG